MALQTGDKVWIRPNPGGEEHPAIVIRVAADGKSVLVLSGTGIGPRDIPYEKVDPARRATAALKLTKITYFYQSAVHVRAIEDAKVRETPPLRCPMTLWEKIQELAKTGARERLSKGDFAEWWPEPDA